MTHSSYSPIYLHPPHHPGLFLQGLGAFFLLANKFRHTIRGYTTPRNFSSTDIQKALAYDQKVVQAWLHYLEYYTQRKTTLKDKVVLELGPGADLGVGLLLLAQGAKQYYAIDKHQLTQQTPLQFYKELFNSLRLHPTILSVPITTLEEELALTLQRKKSRLQYIVEKNFDLTKNSLDPIDIVFSQAALEHFDHLPQTLQALNTHTKSGTIFLGEIDLMTHTRWIREHDPLNIYRFSDRFYNLCKFSGSPNRLRPYEYKNMLKKAGWEQIKIIPLKKLNPEYSLRIIPKLNKKFQTPQNEMDILTCMILATKK